MQDDVMGNWDCWAVHWSHSLIHVYSLHSFICGAGAPPKYYILPPYLDSSLQNFWDYLNFKKNFIHQRSVFQFLNESLFVPGQSDFGPHPIIVCNSPSPPSSCAAKSERSASSLASCLMCYFVILKSSFATQNMMRKKDGDN